MNPEMEKLLKVSEDDYFKADLSEIDVQIEDVNGKVEVDNVSDLLDVKINVNPQSLSIDSILRGLIDGYYVIPPFQRRYVWDKDKVAFLALSIIKNIPIPPMYVYVEQSNKKMVVLDGQQRMISVFLYFNDLIYSGSDNNIDFFNVAKLNTQLRELEQNKESLNKIGAPKKNQNEIDKKIQDVKKQLLEKHGMKPHAYVVPKEDQSYLDISYREFDRDSRKYLIRKTMNLTTVECNSEYPQKVYANIFKLLNSGGKALGEQEIRNGIYWETNLYKSLYAINAEENSVWRKIYGKISIYSKDMEILLKAMALSHYVKLRSNKAGEMEAYIAYSGFSWIKIMEDYSVLSLTDPLTEDIERMKKYLKNIVGCESSSMKCRKAVFEATFVALSLAFPEMDKTIDYESLCKIGDSFGEILSSKGNVEERINIALKKVVEMYND